MRTSHATAILIAIACAGPAGRSGVAAAAAQTKAPAPRIPVCAGMTLVTAVNDATGDYESIKTIDSVSDTEMRISYSAQKMDYGDMFSTDPPRLRDFASKRVVRFEDVRTSRAYLQEFESSIPEVVPGMTALGTSSLVLAELKKQGEAEFGISHWVFVVPPSLDPNDSQSVYRKQMKTRSKVVQPSPVMLTVLVNGVPTELPAIHTRGDFYSYISEFWFLDQADNPLTLKFRIGIDEIKPLSAEDRTKCASDTKLLGYMPQHCVYPDGGDRSTLELVKINYRCAATPPAGGMGGPPPAAAGGGETGTSGSGEAALEQSLMKDGRAQIPDIYFASGSDRIRKESEGRLLEIANVLKRHPDWKLNVEGHTDGFAADDFNLKLSQRRAVAVKNALVTRYGIAAGRLTPQGFGETRPRASNDTSVGRAQNRRVELVRVP
jgi:outer membrane protein OmpA-like peptidoglycan-associated protein